jgi:PKD repeat protein
MKVIKCFVVFLLVISVTAAFAKKADNDAVLISHTQDQTVLQFDITSYDFENIQAAGITGQELLAPNMGKILKKGAPDLPKMSAAVIIPDEKEMEVKILNSSYVDIQGVELAPSRGNLLRTVNPDDIPYEYGMEYQTDAFYPGNLVELTDPYITRDYRGQAVIAYPFQYNPVTKVLRVYTKIKVKVAPTGNRGKNTLDRKEGRKVPREFRNVYARHYMNYEPVAEAMAALQYTPLTDDIGTMLIVSYSSFMDEMADFVTWKESIGYTVDLVDYSTIGSSSALKTYVANYYNTNGLTFLLLVGDHAQVPTSSTSAGDSDNNYGYIAGSDSYLDIFVGRFSAETATHVTTQVDRTVHYERDVLSSASFFRHSTGMGSSEGPGHDSEYDYQHINYILSDLSGYGYSTSTNHQSGGSASNLSSLVNNGTGAMWYCGHGSTTAWTCGWTFSTTNVNALVNEYELPVIFSVACVVGNFRNNTCFCEAWLRATNNGNPTGAVAHAGSTINQSWVPPMDAQDEMADLLVSTSGPKRTFGGVFVNGMFRMIDLNGSGGISMADTWTCFGDPSVQLRTPGTPDGPEPVTPNPPVAQFTADDASIMAGESVQFTDQSTNTPTSWSWTFEGGTPATSTAQNPTVTYSTPGTYDVTLIATNASGSDTETKLNYITVTALQAPVANFVGSPTTVQEGQSVSFTDQSSNSPTSWSWTFTGGTPATSTAQNPTVTYNTAGAYTVSLVATNATGSDTETKTGYITVSDVLPTVGLTDVYSSTSVSTNRRAMPFTMPENGTINSISMYHDGGSGNMILAVYDGASSPQNRIGVTASTAVSGGTGWQTINLTSPAAVSGGSTIWLAWVYESNPGIRYTTGSPGRMDAGTGWSGGMPDPFGSASQADYLYSIYATYTPTGGPSYGTVGIDTVYTSTSVSGNRRAMPFTMTENGTIESITMYHDGGSGNMILAVYDGASSPQNRIAVTPTTAVSGATGWQTINLTTPVAVTSGTTIWLAWVYESNPGIRYTTGSPGRMDAGVGWSSGMPDPFGSATQTSYLYSIYATYVK